MYGYVNVNRFELKVKEYYEFRGFYCGLCVTLGKKYGLTGRLSLSYDMTFLIVLLTSLYEPEAVMRMQRCFVHPLNKSLVITNRFSEYAADMNIALACEKFSDDVKDEKSIKAAAGLALYGGHYKKIKKKYKRQCKAIKRELELLSELEKKNSDDIEEVSAAFGRLMAELFVYEKDNFETDLRLTGFFLGKFIYLMDAYEDISEDIKKGSYNPFKKIYKENDFENKVNTLLTLTMSECATAFERLPLIKDIDILRNILYDGVWSKYDMKNEKPEGNDESIRGARCTGKRKR